MREVLAAFALLFLVIGAWAEDFVTRYPNCRGWIDLKCCCSNNACREVTEDEVQQIGENLYLIVPTGEKIPRTDWSKDGRFIRCSYTQGPGGTWLVGPQYRTSCLYPPPPSS